MKTILVFVIVLMISAQSAYAETTYQAGFKRGVSDGNSQSDLGPVLCHNLCTA